MTATDAPSPDTTTGGTGSPSGSDWDSEDVHAVTAYLHGQELWLQRGLLRANDRVAVALVIDTLERSHDRWMQLIAEVCQALGSDAGEAVAALYGSYGQIVGSLERGVVELLDPAIAAAARRVLAAQLREQTAAVLCQLQSTVSNATSP